MNDGQYPVLLEQAQTCARQVGRLFMDWYKEGPFARELSTDETVFLNNTDFRAILIACLFWEFKRLGLWNSIDDDDWDDVCDLAMKNAFNRFCETLDRKDILNNPVDEDF